MAKYSKRKTNRASSKQSYLSAVVGVILLGLLAFGSYQFFGVSERALATEPNVASVSDREIQFLGPANDPASVALAEAGDVDKPTLVWFHADWCHVCQEIKPEVVDMGEAYEGEINFVRINIDYGESRDVVRRYGVRATPTFVLFDETGQVRGNIPGWPGYDRFTDAFDQLLAATGS